MLLAIFDFPLLVVGLREAIDAEPDMTVVGVVPDRDALREALESTTADVVITECLPFSRQGCTSFAALETIRLDEARDQDPGPRVPLQQRAVQPRPEGRGRRLPDPRGRADRRRRRPALRQPRRDVRQPAIVTRMVNTYVLRTPGGTIEDAYDTLSDREKEVLLLAAVGHANREIARQLHVSEQTVHNHRANIMEKLGVHDRVELLKFAIRRGVIEVADL